MTSATPPTTQLDPNLPIAQQGGAWGYVPDEAFQQMHEQLFGKAGDGSPLGALLDSFGEQAGFDARMVLASGIANGVNPKALASQLAQVLETSRSRAQTIARTEMLRSYRDAQILNYRANSDVVNGWMWSADGANCCAACMYMDGTTHTNDEWMDSHCNCRCVPLPITKSWADILEPLGIDYSDIPDTSIDLTYESALERIMQASAQFQRSILGPAKWEAWMRGDLQMSDLVGVKSDAKWGDSIYEKSLKELGLNANDYLAAPIPADADTVPYYREAGTRKWVRLDELPPNDGYAYYREPGSAKWVRVDESTYTEHQSAISARSGTYPDGREWRVREYTGPTPPSETEANGMAGLGRSDGETWAPKWEQNGDVWVDTNARFAGDDAQCLRCDRIYEGPHAGEYLDHMVYGSHGSCAECYELERIERLEARIARVYPDLSDGEVSAAARAYLDRIPDPLAESVRQGSSKAWIEYSQKVEREAVEAARGTGGAPGGAVEHPSALPSSDAFTKKVVDTLGKDTASEWSEALGETGQLQGPIAERPEVLAWEPRAVSSDVSAALRDQLNGVHVNLDELHPAAANQFAQVMQVLRADFPEVADYLEYIGQTGKDWSKLYPESTLGRSRTAMAASNGQGIGFNRYFWSAAKTDLADLTALLRDQVEQGWFYDGYGSPGATLAHEFGHSTYQWAMKQGGEIRQLVMDYVGQWGEKQPGFSAYAAVDHHELFAEAFSARHFGSAAVLEDPMVADMGRLLEDIRAALGRASTAERAGVAEARAAADLPTRLRELPPGTTKDGVSRMRYEQWRMTQEHEPVVMVFDANRAPLFADRMGETMRATQLTTEQQAIADTASARGPLKVSLWKPEGDGLTGAELRWAVERGANEIQVLTPNGVDVLRAPRGPRVGGAWTPQWVRETVMPPMKEASSDAYAELLAEEMKARGALTSERTPRAFEYAKMEARIQAKLPQRVWQKVADQVPGLEYEHLPLPKQLARGSEIPAGWTPPKPLLPEQPVAAPAPHLSEPRPVPTGVRPVSSETAQRVKSMTPVSMADHQEAVSFGQKLRAEIDAHLPDGLADAARAYRDIRSRAPNLEEWERQWLHTGYTDRFPGIRARDVERDYAAAQRQVTLDMLKQTRGTADSARLAIESSVPEHDEIVAGYLRQAVENVPRDWVEQSNAAGDLYSIRDRSRALGQTGGYFQPLENGRGTLAVRYTQKDSIEALQTTALHEFVHRMEQVNPLISFLEQDFYEARTAGEALVDLTNGVNDQTKLDKWVDEYLGRKPSAIYGTYNGRGWLPGRYVKYSYEILTMGVEMLLGPAGDAALLAQDPEWLHFVLAILFGA
jgi:SPP1 gp7 family putative phage head morphogenesis protein